MGRYVEYKDSRIEWIGKIPTKWETCRIKTVLRRSTESNHPDAEVLSLYRDYGIVKKNSRDDNWNKTSEDTSNYKYVRINDFVVNKMKAWQGSVATSEYEGIVSPAYYVFRITEENVHPRFIHHLMRSASYLPEYRRLSGGIRPGQWDLSAENFLNLPILLPPKEDQCVISNYLDAKTVEIDGLVVDQQKSINLLKEYRKAVISEAVTKGLDTSVPMKDSGTEWIGEIPEDWKVDKINRLFGKIGSGSTPSSSNSKYYDGTISWIQSGDLGIPALRSTAKKLTQAALDDISALTIYDAPFLVIAMYGASIGSTSISMIDACTNQACCVLAEPSMNMQYAAYAIIAAKQYIVDLGIGGTQPNVSQQLIKAFKLPVPGIEEQRLIANQLDIKTAEIDSLITDKQQLIDKLQEYRKSLISEAVTGKFKVSEVA